MAVHYPFPRIQHIDHVLPFIDDECFRVIEKDCGHTYINYKHMGGDTFPAMLPWAPETIEQNHDHWEQERDDHNHRSTIRRECRGIAFHTRTGELRSRPFHKFFNVGERAEMDIPHLGFDRMHVVQDKVDGSMVRPLLVEGGIRWGTKMGITDTAMLAEEWLVDHPRYTQLANYYIEHGYTPLFEFVSRDNRIVVDYGAESDMILLAVRDNDHGDYLTPATVDRIAAQYGIKSARTYDPVDGDPTVYLSAVKDGTDYDEGIVIQWADGHRAKVKTEAYNILHRVKEAGRTERTLILALFDGDVDDLLPMLPEYEREGVQQFINKFWAAVHCLGDDIFVLFNEMTEEYESKKEFALGTNDNLTQMERGVVFGMWDGKYGATDAALNIIKGGLTSETKWLDTKQNIAVATAFHSWAAPWKGTEDFE